ncbi:MAG: Hsp20 family protein [Pseudomonadota bacterium]
MNSFDFTPLFRHTVGFDRMFDLANSVNRDAAQGYPPYNIEKLDENSYQISMAVAGIAPDDIDVEFHDNVLRISGQSKDKQMSDERQFLYQGIAERSFERRFSLADYIKIVGATMENGLLHIKLKRKIPEEAKPKKIEIEVTSNKASRQISSK